MSTLFFAALITGGQATGYRATVPDLEGLSVEASDLTSLLAEARRLILERLQALADAGEAWPSPTPIEQVAGSPDARVMLIDVVVDDTPVRVNISIGERLLQRLDAAAEGAGMTRSGFIAQAVRVSLGEQPRGGADFDAMGRHIQDELVALGRRINETVGPDSAFSKRMASLDERVFDSVRRAADNVSAAMAKRQAAQRDTAAAKSDEATKAGEDRPSEAAS